LSFGPGLVAQAHRTIRRRESQSAAGIREQPRPKADKDQDFAAQIYH
jgi:hypothetical protein